MNGNDELNWGEILKGKSFENQLNCWLIDPLSEIDFAETEMLWSDLRIFLRH